MSFPGSRDRAAPIRIILVDDQALLRESFQRLLELEDGIEVVGAAGDGLEALALVEQLAASGLLPHVVLMDVRMPRMDGVEATRELALRFPEVGVLILTTFDEETYVLEGLRAGAKGYVLKDVSASQLVDAIRAVHRGEAPLQPIVAAKLLAHLHFTPAPGLSGASPSDLPSAGAVASSSMQGTSGLLVDDLTERECEILRLVARGENNREIGEALYITEGTVKNHVSSILSKLALRDRTQAALWAREHGLA
jgi:DNA-binding NarL/FixJ family response regulator